MIRILELPEDKRIFSSGYNCVLHLHCLVEEVEINAVEALIDPETN
jgi:translation elongation factor EF-1alpha